MIRVASSLLINATPGRVWDLYADVPRSAEWVPFVEEVLDVSGAPGIGQVYRERTRLAGVTDVSEWRIIEWDPPRRQVQFSSSKKIDTRLMIEIESVGGASRVRETAILNSRLPPPFSWLHEALFSIVSRHGLRTALGGAKLYLEAEAL
jgi:polyketide cyclase/dehydrase/lipid transport protein